MLLIPELPVRPCLSSSTFLFISVVLGITRFDLLGDFGRYNWLGNFYIVFLYNMLFAGLTSASLIKTVTWAVQRELIRAFGQSFIFLTCSKMKILCMHIFLYLWGHVELKFITLSCVICFSAFGLISLWAGLFLR